MNIIKIYLSTGEKIEFTGRYREDLQTKNWQYYEKENGAIVHIRKEHFVAVEEEVEEEDEEDTIDYEDAFNYFCEVTKRRLIEEGLIKE